MSKKGKKGTPPHLDKYFQRHIISENQYKFFWPAYWKAGSQSGKDAVVEKFFGEAIEEKRKENVAIPAISGDVRKSKVSASRDISRLQRITPEVKYHVIRRDRFGRFNSRGRSYQAIRTGRKGKKK